MTTILWFSRVLRLADNPALSAALARGGPIVPVFVLDDEEAAGWPPGAASRWWLHHSLEKLSLAVAERGNRLVLRKGSAVRELLRLAQEVKADAVYWNRLHEPWSRAREQALTRSLADANVQSRSFNASLLHDPADLRTKAGRPYTVFTPFWKTLRASLTPNTLADSPRRIPAPAPEVPSDELGFWGLLPRICWDAGLAATWKPGESEALARLSEFLDRGLLGYAESRNTPGRPGTSGLSPYLHFGEIGPRQVWRAVVSRAAALTGDPMPRGAEAFLSEIAWREFSHHLLHHYPDLPDAPIRKNFRNFPWRSDAAGLRAWQKGRTGYPIVDAGMRELWHTGWMHNRVRMIVASFLTKNLLIDWREGEKWFWDTLVDADLANNAGGWQWVAGCGADAAPYFRIFNPVTQGTTHDPDGSYVRRWVPEIAALPTERLHAPWTATPLELSEARVRLGVTYPAPMVDLAATRSRALASYSEVRP